MTTPATPSIQEQPEVVSQELVQREMAKAVQRQKALRELRSYNQQDQILKVLYGPSPTIGAESIDDEPLGYHVVWQGAPGVPWPNTTGAQARLENPMVGRMVCWCLPTKTEAEEVLRTRWSIEAKMPETAN